MKRRGRPPTHGLSRTRLYKVWEKMVRRCSNPKDRAYQWYGGRGINVCERWLKIENFVADVEHLYSPGLEIDRIDNDGNYEPGNVRWVSHAENSKNRRPRGCPEASRAIADARKYPGVWYVVATYEKRSSAIYQSSILKRIHPDFQFKFTITKPGRVTVFQVLCRQMVAAGAV